MKNSLIKIKEVSASLHQNEYFQAAEVAAALSEAEESLTVATIEGMVPPQTFKTQTDKLTVSIQKNTAEQVKLG